MRVLFKKRGDHTWSFETDINFVPRVGDSVAFGDDAGAYAVHNVVWFMSTDITKHHFDATVMVV